MEKIKSITISYWFKELEFNPFNQINEIEDELKSLIDTPFVYNEEKPGRLIGLPRIEGLSSDKKVLFSMSLISANLVISYSDDNEDVLLLINNYVQLLFDILKRVYDVDIVYSSIKIEMIDEMNNSVSYLKNKLKLSGDCEEINYKKGIKKDDYYINYYFSSSKEYNFTVEKKEGLQKDIMDRTMLTSIKEAKLLREYLLTVIEINDRYAFNLNSEYRTTKENIRGMILILQKIMNEKLYKEL